MNIRCPKCQTVFRVNPARIPASGARAKCARCGETFTIAPPQPGSTPAPSQTGAAAAPPQAGSAPMQPRAGSVPVQPRAGSAPVQPRAGMPAVPQARPAASEPRSAPRPDRRHTAPARPEPERRQSPAATPQARPPAVEAPAAGATAVPASTPTSTASGAQADRPVFGTRDPKQRAARIARALVSDIVAYHPDRRDRSLADGSLRQEFRDEILKSWDEYVAQVGVETAKGTPYFRDALNSILAKGQRIF